tara:strand:- start:1102 stop:1311 length:210 start_codon:yes stop_codon:yes gene_type:complete
MFREITMAHINLEIETMNPKTVVRLNIKDGYYEPQQIADLYGAMLKVIESIQVGTPGRIDIKITPDDEE